MQTFNAPIRYRGYNIFEGNGLLNGLFYLEDPWGDLEAFPSLERAKQKVDNFEDVVEQLCALGE